jgi:hypothetical protein
MYVPARAAFGKIVLAAEVVSVDASEISSPTPQHH